VAGVARTGYLLPMTTRRDFLLGLGATALAPTFARAAGPAAPMRTAALSGVGVQLYMLRAQMRTDPEGTLARIAELGYSEIEWWGNWQRTPAQLRATLDAHKLRAPAAHIDPRDLSKERFPALLETAATMGHRSVLVAWTPPDQRKAADDWKRVAATLNEAGAAGASAGVRTGYHNHDFEFQRFGDRTGFEILVAETDARFVDIELDCFWAFKAGFEPLALLRAHRDRIAYLHLKDSSGAPAHAQRDIGAGVIDWKPLMAYAISQRVTGVFVEQDDPPDAWAAAKAGREHLKQLGY
jgi:sugar phosphate isomerase/epimerase